MENKDTVEISTIIEYVRANKVPSKKGRKCVDGRYSGSVDDGKIARPGGDAGFVEILLAFYNVGGLSDISSVEEIVLKVVKATESLGEKFSMHTDFGSTPDPRVDKIGCGHLGKASQEILAAEYEVHPKDMREAIKVMKYLSQQGKIYNANLSGVHQEKAVLVITGEKMTVKPNNGSFMAFIYDQTRDL